LQLRLWAATALRNSQGWKEVTFKVPSGPYKNYVMKVPPDEILTRKADDPKENSWTFAPPSVDTSNKSTVSVSGFARKAVCLL